MDIIKRFFKPSKQSYFLFGPRGTGKTLWLKQEYPDAIYLNLLEWDVYRQLLARPEELISIVESNLNRTQEFIIDEVQKVPELLDAVHFLLNKYPDIQFMLTGSSVRKLKQKGVNLLAGRAILKKMHPYIASELQERFDLEKAVQLGMLPLVWEAKDPELTLKTYIEYYIKEEVHAEGLVRNLSDFARFTEIICFSQGSPLNMSNIATECQISLATTRGYISILEDMMLAFLLPVFTKRAKRALVKHPKFYYFDCGVYYSQRPKGFLDSPSEMAGFALETLVAQHFRAWIDYSNGNFKLYYWQTHTKLEVDFVLYGETGLYAFEIKNTQNPKASMLHGLKAFKEDYPIAKTYLLYGGTQRLKIGDVLCLPIDQFLKDLVPNIIPD